MIINNTYFQTQPLFIPNSEAQPTIGVTTPTKVEELNRVIDRLEYDVLLNALGYDQTAELLSQLNPDGTFIGGAIQKWVDLVDGKSGTQWKGLRYEIGENKVSLLAYYVYYHYLLEDSTFYAVTGTVKSDSANAVMVNPTVKLVTAWNKFAAMYEGDYQCHYNYWNNIFSDWNWSWFPYYSRRDNALSLKKYLKDNGSDYDTSYFREYGFKNRLDL